MALAHRPVAVLACISLAALQLSGLHMHVDENGYVGVPEGPHSHSHAAHNHDAAAVAHDAHDHDAATVAHDAHNHDAATVVHDHGGSAVAVHAHEHSGGPADSDYGGTQDVSLFDLSAGATKLLLALICLTLFVPLLLQRAGNAFGGPALPVLTGRRSRWRPPLRAPPLPA